MTLAQNMTYSDPLKPANNAFASSGARQSYRASASGGVARSLMTVMNAAPIAATANTRARSKVALLAEPTAVRAKANRKLTSGISARYKFLRDVADEEGFVFSEASAKLLRDFVLNLVEAKQPAIVFAENGVLRAIWRNESGEQAAFIFRDSKEVQFVFFVMRDGRLERATGTSSVSGLAEKISGFGVNRLITL